ncbi:hypothetical protein EMIT0P253_70012 [Pseudomonas sp. IT-P253]
MIKTEVAGSLERPQEGKLCSSDKYL